MELCRKYGNQPPHGARGAAPAARRGIDLAASSHRHRVVARMPKATYRQPTNSMAIYCSTLRRRSSRFSRRSRSWLRRRAGGAARCREGAKRLRVNSLRAVPGDARPSVHDDGVPRPSPARTWEQNLEALSGPISAMLERVSASNRAQRAEHPGGAARQAPGEASAREWMAVRLYARSGGITTPTGDWSSSRTRFLGRAIHVRDEPGRG
jgi:hypothetical protein